MSNRNDREYNYSSHTLFEKQCYEKAQLLAKHIQAMLKVGSANGMSRQNIYTQLEHHELPFELYEYIFNDALFLYTNPLVVLKRTTEDGVVLYYLKDKDEKS